jgi:chlorobactene glucosyltransferase
MATILALFITVPLLGISAIAVLNVLSMLRLGRAPSSPEAPLISVLIPARNEAGVIAQTVRSLLRQEYPHFEVIVLDDNSSDNTAILAQQAAAGDARLQIINGAALPNGWGGKNWACHQLSQAANGDYLLFTDADVQWQDGALRAVVNTLQHSHADLLTVWSTQITETWSERLVVPLMAFVILGYLPHLAVNHTSSTAFAAANGQCMGFRRKAYQRIGGHEAVKREIVEDIRLAQRIKRAGLQLRMADGNRLVTCRMYNGWEAVRNGYAKNIIAGYGSLWGLTAGTLFHWALFLLPALTFVYGLIVQNTPLIQWSAAWLTLGILTRALTAAATHQRAQDALLMPVSVLLMTRIALQAVWWHWHGGPQWKGRTLGTQGATHG